ncbi:helix-turn-helix transcriptional regulator [Actinomycetospora sp. TBRC 11914]|uniref:helix-turn-helix domain-containing protein n=1 Tax=Actinomycetospora sp. TBRC 11914 TaxID=2729387 RepID=UPI00145D1C53|nr:helix-turn-helix transcriptional regulator [Actinomycetospora sp. TBRC 11914]NMO90061.1 helix-turn-helix transcriptional regulator [Actinomycetospora sp. TBRC 11914]
MVNEEASDPVNDPHVTAGGAGREEVHAALAAAVRGGMARTGMKQRELAHSMNLSQGRVSQYLNDPKKMPARWERIEELLLCAGADAADFKDRHGHFWDAATVDSAVPVAAPTGPEVDPADIEPDRVSESESKSETETEPEPTFTVTEAGFRPYSSCALGDDDGHARDEAPTGPIQLPPTESTTWLGRHRHLAISLAIAGVLAVILWAFWAFRAVPPPPPPVVESGLPAVVEGAGPNGLTERNSPSKGPLTGTGRIVPDGTPVLVDCAEGGDAVAPVAMSRGYTRTWLRLHDGYYVTSVYVRLRESAVPSCQPGADPLPLALIPG